MAGLQVGILPLRWPLNQRVATLRILTPDPELGWRGTIQCMEHRETQGQRGQAACLMPHSFSGPELGWEQVPRAQDVELSPESSFLNYSICGMGPIAPCSCAGRGLAVVSGVPARLTPASCPSFQGPEAKPHLSLIGGLHEYWELGEGLGGQDQYGGFLPTLRGLSVENLMTEKWLSEPWFSRSEESIAESPPPTSLPCLAWDSVT